MNSNESLAVKPPAEGVRFGDQSIRSTEPPCSVNPLDAKPEPVASNRILGLDVARAIAVGGMATIHFAMVLSGEQMKTSSWGWLVDRMSGRPATVFMILAGIGISLRFSRFGSSKKVKPSVQRISLIKRGVFFLIVGFANLAVWPGDILRVYGVAYLLAAGLVLSANRWLGVAAIAVISMFVAMVFAIDFETNWDFATLSYSHLWTLGGGAMNLFYNGFRAVFPWAGLMFVGMWVGRLDLTSKLLHRWLGVVGLSVWIGTELISWSLLSTLVPLVDVSETESVIALFGTHSLPAMPLFLMSSSGLAVVIIVGCIQWVERSKVQSWRPVAAAGQMAFTWYIAHIVVVISSGVMTGFRGDVPLGFTLIISFLFFGLMVGASWIYRRKFRYGPLEWVLRTAT